MAIQGSISLDNVTVNISTSGFPIKMMGCRGGETHAMGALMMPKAYDYSNFAVKIGFGCYAADGRGTGNVYNINAYANINNTSPGGNPILLTSMAWQYPLGVGDKLTLPMSNPSVKVNNGDIVSIILKNAKKVG